ncbi:MAG: serine protease [Longispora sp.]|nr:serine protease [Longispora sp. (in: high G+C Gram-positive bacteria)]
MLRVKVLLAAITVGLSAGGALAAPAIAAGPAIEHPAIVGGTESPNDAYPFMAALLHKGKGLARDRQFCGGTLIDSNVIMTAAHCVNNGNAAGTEVFVGRTILSSEQGEVRNVDSTYLHPKYRAGERAYDVALVILDKSVPGIRPVLLPTPGTDALLRPGKEATVIGWGNTDTALPRFPDRLREVNVPILTHAECEISYETYDRAVNICAGKEGKDSCQGDSGGPILRMVPGTDDAYQIGIVSYGEGCAALGAPGVYTSTSSAVLWETLYDRSSQAVRLKALLKQ